MAVRRGERGAAHRGKKGEDPLGRNTQWQISLGKSIFGLEEEEEEDLKRTNGFHLHSSPLFLLFFIFFMVAFLSSMN